MMRKLDPAPRWLVANLAVLAAAVAFVAPARGGGGPENVLVVVNANSAGSKEVANHYVRLRDIPAPNVVALDYQGPLEQTTGEVFREQIFRPALEAVTQRNLGVQIDLIAYSTDFPWYIDLRGDFPEDLKLPKQHTPVASLTGATYLFGFAMGKNPGVVSFDSNWYHATPPGQSRSANAAQCRQLGSVPTRGFRFRYGWTAEGQRSDDPKVGRRYLLSTMLGVTTGRGNTVAEVKASLDRALAAEADPPKGTVYFMRNTDIRSTTRHGCFDSAAEQVRRAGGKALVQVGICPTGAGDVAGLMVGAAELELDKAGMTIQPGAICEHLTSYGGILTEPSFQTPLTALIRAGATGSSGSVDEPFAIQAKFPSPALQVHYRRGASLAEAFYQSIAAPYQLLIVGDPLCQPWAKRPTLRVEGWPGAKPTGAIEPGITSTIGFENLGLAPATKPAPEKPDAAAAESPAVLSIRPVVTAHPEAQGAAKPSWELFIDGRLRMRLPSGTKFDFAEKDLGPGWHELRCVGMSPDPIESQRRQMGALVLPQGAKASPVSLTAESESTPPDGKVALSAAAKGAERIVIRHNWREVATIGGERGGALVSAELVGRGPVRLQAFAQPGDIPSRPVWTRIE